VDREKSSRCTGQVCSFEELTLVAGAQLRTRRWSGRATSGSTFHEWRLLMNVLLWLIQVLLALAFFAHGCLLLFPPASLVAQMNASLPRWFQLFLGGAEALAGIGLTLPGVTRIQPWLVPAAAVGLMIVMISATVYHLQRGEVSSAITTIVLLALSTFIAYMRWRVAPIPPRTTARESLS
jgi:putative oxidoreductase